MKTKFRKILFLNLFLIICSTTLFGKGPTKKEADRAFAVSFMTYCVTGILLISGEEMDRVNEIRKPEGTPDFKYWKIEFLELELNSILENKTLGYKQITGKIIVNEPEGMPATQEAVLTLTGGPVKELKWSGEFDENSGELKNVIVIADGKKYEINVDESMNDYVNESETVEK